MHSVSADDVCSQNIVQISLHHTRQQDVCLLPVLEQDHRKSQDPSVKGVVVAKVGPVIDCVQVKELFWKQHIDQLKDLSGMKIKPH